MNRNETEDDRIVPMTLGGQVAERLRNWILVGVLEPGEVLVERALSQRLGVSRTPLREGLRQLEQEGLINLVPNRQPRVADPSLAELLALLEVHILLEAHGTKLAAENIAPEELVTLRRLLDDMDRSLADRGSFEFFELDMKFHRKIVEASGNQPLIEAHRHFNARIYRARFLSTQSVSGRPLMREQHLKIFEALKRGDGAQAKACQEEHLRQLGRNIKAIFEEKADRKEGVPEHQT